MEAHLPFRRESPESSTGTALITAVRSTLIISSIQAIRARGFYDRYFELLSTDQRSHIGSLISGQWVPVALVLEHYLAVDALKLDVRTIESIGGEVAERINQSVLSVAVKLSRHVGATPWNALSLAHRINDLNWRGGDVAVWKIGSKEALYEWRGQPCAAIPYFVTSFAGYMRALVGLFCEKAHARPVLDRCDKTTIACRLSWI